MNEQTKTEQTTTVGATDPGRPPIGLLSLTNDYVFRRIFAQKNVDALADFLSLVLDMPPDELDELRVEDPNLYRERADGKSSELRDLNRTVSVIITDFALLKENNDCVNRFRWYNMDNGTMLTDVQR